MGREKIGLAYFYEKKKKKKKNFSEFSSKEVFVNNGWKMDIEAWNGQEQSNRNILGHKWS